MDVARPALPASSSSTVTTIVVLSSPTIPAISVCVNSPVSAVSSTECCRGEMSSSSSAAVNSVISPWLARDEQPTQVGRQRRRGLGCFCGLRGHTHKDSPPRGLSGSRRVRARWTRVPGHGDPAPAHGRGDPPAGYSIPSRSSRRSSARQCRRTRTDRSRCTRVPSSRSIARRDGDPDRLDHLAAGADQDPLLGLGLGQDHRLDPDQIGIAQGPAVFDRLDLHLDRVRHLLAGAREHLLAHELGEPHVFGLVRELLGLEVERALGQQRHEAVDERSERRRRWRAETGKISSATSSSAAACSAAAVRACCRCGRSC